jgi:protease II
LGEDAEKQGSAGTETDKNLNQCLYYHVLGTPQSEDRLVYRNPEEPVRGFCAIISSPSSDLCCVLGVDVWC